jgi:CheY-like chemotaxis protein
VAADHYGASLEGVKVLVVEDDRDTLDLVRRVLEEHRAEVLTAGTATKALEILATARPDVLVSDLGLPETDGYELIRRIRGMGADSGGRIPAVALTAFARSEDRTRALRAGYQTHLAKPIEPAELVAAVASFAALAVSRRKEASG